MAHITNIPLELLDMVLSLVNATCLAALVRSCRSLRTSAEQFLYKSITMTWEHDKDHPRIALLLNRILARPDLAARTISIGFLGHKPRGRSTLRVDGFRNNDPSISIWNGNETPTVSEKAAVVHVLQKLRLKSVSDIWYQDYLAGEVDVFVALILSQLKNLEVLRLSSEFQGDTKFIGLMLKATVPSSEPPSCLAKLREADLGYDIDHPYHIQDLHVDVNMIFHLLRLPVLSKLSVAAFDSGEVEGEISSLQSPLTSLNLKYCHTSHPNIALTTKLMSATLTTLEYHVAQDVDRPIQPLLLQSLPFVEMLKSVAGSLKHLRLSATLYIKHGTFPTPHGLRAYCYGNDAHSLRFLTNLETLDVPVVTLLGWVSFTKTSFHSMTDLLPSTLRSLTLTDEAMCFEIYKWENRSLLDHVGQYIGDAKTSTPKLETLKLYLPNANESWFESAESILMEMSERAGVTCRIEK